MKRRTMLENGDLELACVGERFCTARLTPLTDKKAWLSCVKGCVDRMKRLPKTDQPLWAGVS